MNVTVPEKTLEHWISQYITYRYRSHASLWWPAFGQDIDIRSLPVRPGKAIQLEVKTSTVTGPNRHDVHIDLRQLRRYRQLPFAHQPFYVFPRPYWRGTLEQDAHRLGDQVTELAFKRSGRPRWFGHWMIVLTAEQVEAILSPHPTDNRTRRLVRFMIGGVGVVTSEWANGATPSITQWSDFWDVLNRCGLPDWPQIVRLPIWLDAESHVDTSAGMVRALQTAATELQGRPSDELATYESTGKGGFIRVPADREDTPPNDSIFSDVIPTENRQIVFIDAAQFA